MPGPKPKSLRERFETKVDRSGGPDACWPWTRARRKGKWNYGKFSVTRGTWRSAHVIAWELENGPVPAGHMVRHSCDNPPCCNPAHLLIGTYKQNTADMDARGRRNARGATGSRNSHAKFTEAAVVRLRERFAAGEQIVDLAAEEGVWVSTISDIVNGRKWSHVGGPIRTPTPGRRRDAERGRWPE